MSLREHQLENGIRVQCLHNIANSKSIRRSVTVIMIYSIIRTPCRARPRQWRRSEERGGAPHGGVWYNVGVLFRIAALAR
jgi:hypothetical protein